jgi:hypothetical protein
VRAGVTLVLICADPVVLSVLLIKNVHLESIVFLVMLSVIVFFSNVPNWPLFCGLNVLRSNWPFSGFRVTLEHCLAVLLYSCICALFVLQ